MKVAIIGNSSFLARHIKKCLAGENIQIQEFGSLESTADFHYFRYPENLIKVSHLKEAKVILYLAGAGIQPKSNPDLATLYGVNTFEPIRILNALREDGYSGTFISFGSYFEIGNCRDHRAFSEEEITYSALLALNEYGTSKRLFSRFLTDLNQQKLPFKLLHFYLPNVYGVGENSQRLIPYIVNSLKSNESIHLSNGHQIRQYLHVNDVASFITRLIQQSSMRIDSGFYNLGSRDILSVKELVMQVLQQASELNWKIPEIKFGEVATRDMHAPYLAINDQRVRKVFEWNPTIELSKGLKDYFAVV